MPRRAEPTVHSTELAPLASLKPHPQNYREHPADQRQHLAQSMREHGFYRNVVVARDGTILAGHGVVAAATDEGLETIPVVRLDLDPDDPKAQKILIGDNEISRLAEIDDRALSELLKEIADVDLDGLLGTGYDESMLANLVFVTRTRSEIGDEDDAAAWVGLPEYLPGDPQHKLIVTFDNDEDRVRFLEMIGVTNAKQPLRGGAYSCRWPPQPYDDLNSVRFG